MLSPHHLLRNAIHLAIVLSIKPIEQLPDPHPRRATE